MATGAVRHSNRGYDNLFSPGMAVLILGIVFLGFARTYYLAGVFHAQLPNLLINFPCHGGFLLATRT